MTTEILTKRAYEPADAADGFRIYVDRLWPRGLSHETFHYDLWNKALAPSTALRQWFHVNPEARWPEFQRRYAAELHDNPALAQLRAVLTAHPTVTLLYSSHDREQNNAVALRNILSAKAVRG